MGTVTQCINNIMASVAAEIAPASAILSSAVEDAIMYQKFGEMQLPEEESEDVDYSPSEAESEDSLEWASETERTIAEDSLSEGKVGIDFYGAAMSVATEYVASYKPVQMGLRFASVIPVLSVQRAARAARRAGAKNIEIESCSEPSIVISIINSALSMLGFSLAPAVEDSSKPFLEPGTEPFTPEQEFGEMTLSDYDSDEDADFEPGFSASSSDELE